MKKKDKKASQYADKLKNLTNNLENVIWDIIHDLRESEQRYRSIVEFAVDGIITIDPDNHIVSWNQGAENIFHFKEKEVLGEKLDNLIVKDDVESEAMTLSKKVMQGESIRNFEAIRYTKKGNPKNVLVSAAPIKNENDEVEAASIMYKDITELKNAYEQLVQTEKQATLGVISGSIGHELNNLVGGLLLHAKLLKQHYNNPDRVQNIADLLLTNLEKVAMHGKNLLSLSRPNKPRFEPLDLNAVLKETTDTLKMTGVLKHYEIQELFCDQVCYVHGDKNLLEQVIRNLEINAAHAMESGGLLKIKTHVTENGNYFEMEFIDNGPGIDPEIKEKIFEPFFTTKAEGIGTGLGLPIVKDIVEQHKGYIKIKSQAQKGTRVIVGIPVVKT
ncbi:PAS domain S-box protein [candidate division KSB1 bacterium]|nr:PAS domain S-box protein [candidate division KSB1 bacterium]